jgi:hypothetical protein
MCQCQYHVKKRNRAFKKTQLLHAAAVSGPKRPRARSPQDPSERKKAAPATHIDPDDSVDFDYWDAADSPEDALDSDGFAYLQLLESRKMWTRVNETCLCLPGILRRSGDLELDEKMFCHAYKIILDARDGSTTFVQPDCECRYARRLFELTRAGFSLRTLTRAELLAFFDVGEPCLHAR